MDGVHISVTPNSDVPWLNQLTKGSVMLLKIGLAFAGVIIALLGFAATRPDSFRIERTVTIKASPEKIFPHIASYHQWEAWSPWEKIDPAVKRTYAGAVSGKGAQYGWAGNKDVGKGSMEILDVTPSSRILMKVDFYEPFEGHNQIEFTLRGEGDSTKVTQAMFGPAPSSAKCWDCFSASTQW